MDAQQQPIENVDDGSPQAKRVRLTSETEPVVAAPPTELSFLERLPKELMWKVLERVPESALEMRKLSSSIKDSVDDFTVGQSTTPLVSKISFSDAKLPNSTRPAGQLDIMVDVPMNKLGLFFRRLQLTTGCDNFKEKIKEMYSNPDEEPSEVREDIPKLYDLKFDVDVEGTEEKLEYLSKCLGKRFGQVELLNCYGEKRLAAITQVLKGKNFPRMKVVADEMPEDVVKHFLTAVLEGKVQTLMMAGKFETTFDTLPLLRQLSAHLNALQIYQTPNENAPSVTRLFGKDNVDWSSIIIDLLAGHLSKLAIINHPYPGYLTGTGTDKIIDALPKLNKPVWFVGTCNQYEEGFSSDFHKEYLVKVKAAAAAADNQAAAAAQANPAPPKPKQYLQIKHNTRLNEPNFDNTSIDIEAL